jgi:hypothetical protein
VPPPIRYARSGGVSIAYQIAGEGAADVLMIPGWVTHLALDWHEPRWVAWFERMSAFARIVRFDKRGTGMSDRPQSRFRAPTRRWTYAGCASLRMPTLVINREHDPVAPGETGRYLAERIPGSRFIQLPGSAHAPWLGDAERFCSEVEHFVTGVRPLEREPGAVRTILHCDIVDSTRQAAALGDERWSEILADYGRAAEQAVNTHGGRIVDRTGDGFMAAFEGPVGAIRAARRLQQDLQELDHEVRAGLHIGEVREDGGLLRGIAVTSRRV